MFQSIRNNIIIISVGYWELTIPGNTHILSSALTTKLEGRDYYIHWTNSNIVAQRGSLPKVTHLIWDGDWPFLSIPIVSTWYITWGLHHLPPTVFAVFLEHTCVLLLLPHIHPLLLTWVPVPQDQACCLMPLCLWQEWPCCFPPSEFLFFLQSSAPSSLCGLPSPNPSRADHAFLRRVHKHPR